MAQEALIRLAAFLGLFLLFAPWEARAPRRARAMPRALRVQSGITCSTHTGPSLKTGAKP